MSLKICDKCKGQRFRSAQNAQEIDEYGFEVRCDDCKGLGLVQVDDEIDPVAIAKMYEAKEAQSRQLKAADRKKQTFMKLCRFNSTKPSNIFQRGRGSCTIDDMKDCIGQCLFDGNKIVKGVDNSWELMH